MKLTGAQILVQMIKSQGVDTIFGYPGGAVLPIYDEIFQQDAIRHILVRHEQGAAHAADGYARASGKVGVVMRTLEKAGLFNGDKKTAVWDYSDAKTLLLWCNGPWCETG